MLGHGDRMDPATLAVRECCKRSRCRETRQRSLATALTCTRPLGTAVQEMCNEDTQSGFHSTSELEIEMEQSSALGREYVKSKTG